MRKVITIVDYVQTLAALGYTDFALNEAGYVIEINGRKMDKYLDAEVRALMANQGMGNKQRLVDIITMLAARNRHHPVKSFLTMCGLNYDGGQHISYLSAHFTETTKPNKMFPLILRKWLVGAVAKVFGSGEHQNFMLCLDGPQGIGKSYFVQWLASPPPLPKFFIEQAIRPDSNDCWLRLMRTFLWEVSELSSTVRQSDLESLKAFISTKNVTARVPYGHFDTESPAMASMVGTLNNSSGFLLDQTGNRRFLAATIERIDWGYTDEIDPCQIWGEAFAAYKAGEDWRPTYEELRLAAENNENFKIPNVIEGYLAKHFEVDATDVKNWTSTADIVERLQSAGYRGGSSRSVAMTVAATLREMGLAKERRVVNQMRAAGFVGIKPYP